MIYLPLWVEWRLPASWRARYRAAMKRHMDDVAARMRIRGAAYPPMPRPVPPPPKPPPRPPVQEPKR